ncbi:MAG TPA: FAD-binding oxidoreductase, partial [Chloroflexota bacterium]|nr:FAD-binding oxidoreductase [Chloroflexota bacterium]
MDKSTADSASFHGGPRTPGTLQRSGRTLTPASLPEAEEQILASWRAGQSLYLERRQVADEASTLSLAGLDRILNLSVEDAVAVVEAGVPVQALREAAAAKGLWCPPLRHLPPDGLIGAVVAGGHGWRSRGHAGVGDYLLGSRFICPSVGLVRHGGTAIKNATGYNLSGLLVGSRGSLGIILSLNLRLVPLPRECTTRSFRVPVADAASLAALLAGTTTPLPP